MDKTELRREIQKCEEKIRKLREQETQTDKKKGELQQAKRTLIMKKEVFGTTIHNRKKRLTKNSIPVGNVSIQNYVKLWSNLHNMSHGSSEVSKIDQTFQELEDKIIVTIKKCENEITNIKEEINREQQRMNDLRQELRILEGNHV